MTLAVIKSSAVTNTTDYGMVIVGGFIYAGSPTVAAKDFLNSLSPGHASQDFGPYVFTTWVSSEAVKVRHH